MKRLALAAALALGTALPAAAFDISAMTDDERAAFRDEIRAYLLDNPEVLLEAIGILENREAEAAAQADAALVAANAEAIFEDDWSWIGGNPEGDVTIVEFLDYRCSYCRRAFPEVEELLTSDGNIRIIVKEFPILGEESVLASRFAISTLQNAGDEAYKAVHDALMTMRASVTLDTLEELGDTLGLDTDAIIAGMGDPEVDRIIRDNRALAQTLQITGTPTFVFGDALLRGYVPLDGMRQIVNDQRSDG